MRPLEIIIFLLTFWMNSYGQDGSDIRYLKVYEVDSSLTGQYVHFDFFRLSYRGRTIDTVTININTRPTKFIERRKDNAYNNWFSEQWLQSIDKIDGQTIKISKFKLERITPISFEVTMYMDFYDANDKLLIDKSRQVEYRFDKKDIGEVLVKSKQL